MNKRDKWFVPGEFGGTFTNLREAFSSLIWNMSGNFFPAG